MSEKLDGLSMNIEQADKEKLRTVFPQCFVEDKLDIDKLLNLCGEYITDDFERYNFTWKGKSECFQIAGQRSAGTLRPCEEESVNFDTTQNVYIEGDNLEVLKLLQKSYYGKVKMIYIDPPYNTGNDFVYEDDFKDPMAKYKEITSQTTKSNPETMGRFHTAWLNMMYPRLRLAANLLREDGVCFISIDDNELYNLKKLCDEIFGEENFVGNIIVKSNPRGSQSEAELAGQHEYLLVYAKNLENAAIIGHELSNEMASEYKYEDEKGKYRLLGLRQRGGFWRRSERPNLFYSIYVNPLNGTISLIEDLDYHVKVNPIQPTTGEDGSWRWGKEKLENDISYLIARKVNRGGKDEWDIFQKDYIGDDKGSKRTKSKSLWDNKEVNYQNGTNEIKKLISSGAFSYSKPVYLINQAIKMIGNDKNDIILDFFSGSATTAHAVMQLNAEDGGNRRFIMIQLPELCEEKTEAYKSGYKNICEIGKERIRRAGNKILEEKSQELEEREKPLDVGFKVFKLDNSNLKIWDNTPIKNYDKSELERRLMSMLEIIKADRREIDVVYEVMLKLGQDLCEDILQLDINGKFVYGIGKDVTFMICLAKHITPKDAEEMAEYAPGRIVFSEQCFDSSTDMANVRLILKDNGINIKML